MVDFVAMVFGMPFALFPALAERIRRPSALGLMYAAPAVGALLASLTGGWTPRVHRHGRAIMLAAVVWGAAIVAFGLSTALWPALGCLAVAGGADAVSGIFRMTMWNQTIPDALRGRLASIEMVSYMSGPQLGNARAGAVASLVGVRGAVVLRRSPVYRRGGRARAAASRVPALRRTRRAGTQTRRRGGATHRLAMS